MIEERKRILKMVEEGKLTVDEALTLLEGLEQANNEKEQKHQEIITELSTEVKFKQAGKEDPYSYNQESVKTKFIHFVDNTLKKIRDLDLDFNFGHAVEVRHIFQHSDVLINQIDLDVANGSVNIKPWDTNDVRIECDAKVYKVETQENARQAFLQDVLFSIEGGKLWFAVQKKQMKVNAVLYVPEADYDRIKVRMFNGPISGERLKVKDFKAKTANGVISCNQMTTDAVELETANGHIKMLESQSQNCEIETINGTIHVTGVYEKVDFQSFNGNIICSFQNNACHTAFIKTTTGNIDLYVPKDSSIDGEFKSNLGGFTCELPGMDVVEDKNEVVQKSLRFKVNKQADRPMRIIADTKTGSVLIKQIGGKSL